MRKLNYIIFYMPWDGVKSNQSHMLLDGRCVLQQKILWTNLVKKINDLCGHTYNRYDEKLLDFESDS